MNTLVMLVLLGGLGVFALTYGRRVRFAHALVRPRARVRRQAIDIDLVLEEKYPNRRPVVPEPVPVAAAVAQAVALPAAPPVAEPVAAAPEAKPWPEPAPPRTFWEPPVVDAPPWAPIPGEPDGPLVGPPRRPAQVVEFPDGPGLVGGSYEALRRRRDRVAAQAAAAFAEVHRLRTESLRRAAQAEHNNELAATARARASRMTVEARRYEAQGRRRTRELPDATDAYQDVHRFRIEALRRAHEAEHTAEAVQRARARATKLLAEQRRLDHELAKLRRDP